MLITIVGKLRVKWNSSVLVYTAANSDIVFLRGVLYDLCISKTTYVSP